MVWNLLQKPDGFFKIGGRIYGPTAKMIHNRLDYIFGRGGAHGGLGPG